jgi:GDP-mannose transporter
MCDTIAVDNWTRVVYTNAMAGSLLAIAIPFAKEEHAVVAALPWATSTLSTLLFSCLIGIGVSHSAYVMRSACSATMSAVVGILCKVLTVLINIFIWDKHASASELGFLAIGLLAGAFYVQAPLRVGMVDGVCKPVAARCVNPEDENSAGNSADADMEVIGEFTSDDSSPRRESQRFG